MSKKKKLILAGVLILAVAIGGMIIYKNTHGNVTSYEPEFEEEQIREDADESVGKAIKIPGYTTIYVAAGTEQVSVDLENPEENEVYFEISFVLTDSGEEIYKSKYIAPGQHLYDITLNKPLEAGEYDMTIHYATYAQDEAYTPQNGADVNCKLIAQ